MGTQNWFNTPGNRPLTLAGLRGHVVLVDFWTYSCINCLRSLPYLNAWNAKYASKGFTIIGIHTPEFPFEHSASNVAAAIQQNGIHYPVVQDNNYATWNAYRNEYWPAEYLIDAQGRIRLADFGEGEYAAKERAIRSLLVEAGASGLGEPTHTKAQQPSEAEVTPETYLGSEKAAGFENGEILSGSHDYGPPGKSPAENHLSYAGNWLISAHSAIAQSNARLQLNFVARRVYLVMGSPEGPRHVRILLDGHPIPNSLAGPDVHNGSATVGFDRLYRIVELPKVENHVLTVEPEAGVAGYSFTFG